VPGEAQIDALRAWLEERRERGILVTVVFVLRDSGPREVGTYPVVDWLVKGDAKRVAFGFAWVGDKPRAERVTAIEETPDGWIVTAGDEVPEVRYTLENTWLPVETEAVNEALAQTELRAQMASKINGRCDEVLLRSSE